MAMVRSSVKWISLWVVLALILGGWVLRTESASPGGTVSADVTAQVRTTFSGLRLNRATQTYDTVATLTNPSADPIHAPLELHIASITPATVTLQNPGGTASDGHPYVAVPLPTGTLAPGATITNIVLRFRNPGNVQFTFTHQVIGMLAAGNKPPVAHAGPDQAAETGQTVILNGAGSRDADGDPLTYQWSWTRRPPGSTAPLNAPTEAKARFAPDLVGSYIAQLIVNDRFVSSDPDTATVTVTAATPANRAPQILSSPVTTATVGQPWRYDVNATDADGDTLTYALNAAPASMSINSSSGLIAWTPTAAGEVTVRVEVHDGHGGKATQSFSLQVQPENLPPLPDDPATVAPPINATVATTTFAATRFLYTGSSPIQTGVAPGTIEPKRAAVLRGKVLEQAEQSAARRDADRAESS